jgi:hypothetical protein
MRHHAVWAIAVAAFLPMIAMAQAPAPTGADNSAQVQELTQLIRNFFDIPKFDPKSYDEFYAADATFTGSTGRVRNKADIMRFIEAARGQVKCCFTTGDFKVHLYGEEMAVVTFGVVERSPAPGEVKNDAVKDYYRATGTFRLSDGKWQAVALQITKFQEEPAKDKSKLN